ncbi:MAG: transcription antitermination factor NusB [Planctomycetes bacterium]|nr:transcription antitermination factor NusB [Planctomycetota bacterium]
MHKRTRARRLVMLVLYQADLLGEEHTADAREWLKARGGDSDLHSFSMELFDMTFSHIADIDPLLESVAQNWHLGRMAAIDRALLRMAACELIYYKDAPPKVVINEAVELAKRYSTAASGSFVNGILDKIHKDRVKSE